MKLQVARMLGKLESEIYAGRMSAGDAIETLVMTTEIDADELDLARDALRATQQEI